MSGSVKGAAKRITDLHPKALYTHCNSHKLNLCILNGCSINLIRYVMDTMSELGRFFEKTPVRASILQKYVTKLYPNTQRKKPVALCQTRWVERIDSMDTLIDLYDAVLATLDEIRADNYSSDAITKATGLYTRLTTFEAVITLCTVRKVLSYTRSLTIKLQKTDLDIVRAGQFIDALVTVLQDKRVSVSAFHQSIFDEAEQIAKSNNIDVALKRAPKRAVHRQNVPAENPCQHYEHSLTIPLLDHVLSDINERFSRSNNIQKSAYQIIPPHQPGWIDHVLRFADIYESDLPSVGSLTAELELWAHRFADESREMWSLADLLQTCDMDLYPNVHTILRLIGTFPITSCECERSVSMLRRLKTYMRSTMSTDRLNGLALLHCHYSLKLDMDAIIDNFALANPRRLEVIDILNSDQCSK